MAKSLCFINVIVVKITTPNARSIIVPEEKSDLEEMILYLLTSKDEKIYEKVKNIAFVEDFKVPTNKKILALMYSKYEDGDIKNQVKQKGLYSLDGFSSFNDSDTLIEEPTNSIEDLLKYYELDSEGIVKKVLEII